MEIKGFIKLPIKTMTSESIEKLEKAYEYYEEEYNRLKELFGKDPGDTIKPVDEEEYIEMTDIYVKPEAILSFKKADDGHVDVSTSSIMDYSRVYMKYEEFLELLKSTK